MKHVKKSDGETEEIEETPELEKADVVYRYRQTQARILSRRKLLPEEIDVFWYFFRWKKIKKIR